jgi:hypothetical protein
MLGCAAVVACNDPFGELPPPNFANVVDTVHLYALSGTPITLPSGYFIAARQVMRTDQATENLMFDFAFDLDEDGNAKLLPTGALNLGRQSGIQLSSESFEGIIVAPTTGYQRDSAVFVDSGSVAIVHSRPHSCGNLTTAPYFAKLRVITIDQGTHPEGRRIDFEILVDQNCGYRGLEPGLPRR